MGAKNDISSRFIEAFERLIERGSVTDKKDFAAKLGISPSMVTEISKGRSAVGTTAIQNIVLTFDVSADWLLRGVGEMLPQSVPTAQRVPEGSQEGIPLIPISAMAGVFKGEIAVMDYECERYVVPAFKGADFLMRVQGDSMQPTYRPGDIVACQRVPLTDIFFQWGKAYVINTDQGPILKRIRPGHDDEHLLIVSDNAEAYPPFTLHRSQLHAVALVRGSIRLE